MQKTFDTLILSVMISIALTVQAKSESYIYSPPKSSFALSRRAVCTIKDDNIMSKRIPLTQGQFAVVDNKDYEWLNKHKWFAHWDKRTKGFYAIRNGKTKNGKQYLISMSREILGLKYGDKRQADHRNHGTLDNRRLNLRVVSCQQNQFNQKNPKGYYWNKDRGKYLAQIVVNRKTINLGYFRIAEEAHSAYLEAKEVYHKIYKEA